MTLMKRQFTQIIGAKFALILLLSVFMGCNNEKAVYETIETQFKECLERVTDAGVTTPAYMVIPRAGCSGCISTAETFVLSCLKDPKQYNYVKFILTDFDSEKLLRARYGKWYKSDMLIIDKENVFNANKSLKTIYPTIYFFKDAKLVKVSQMSPDENGLSDLVAFKTQKQ